MKFKIINMLVILGMLSVMPLIYMGKLDPMAIFDSVPSVPDLGDISVKAPDTLKEAMRDEKVQVYKWRDENGVMQFSNTPPPEVQAETVELDPNNNLMQAVKVEKKAEPEEEVASKNLSTPYSKKGMKQAMDQAKDVERLLQERHEQQQEMLNNL